MGALGTFIGRFGAVVAAVCAPLAQAAEPIMAASASAADIPALADLLARTGWTPTPELSGVFRPGAVFLDEGDRHTLMVRQCIEAPAAVDTYTALEVVTSLQAGVRVRGGALSARAEGELVRTVKFGVPQHHTLERLALKPTADCTARLAGAAPAARAQMYVVQEVLTAEIAEQTCGRLDAAGRFVGLGQAEGELAAACSQVSLEPVAVAYRVVPVDRLGLAAAPLVAQPAVAGALACPWGAPQAVSSTRHALTVNGVTLDVRGHAGQTEAAQGMHACGRTEAARAFDTWRRRQRTATIAAATLVGYWPFGIGIWAQWSANRWRDRTERLLLDPAYANENDGKGWRKQVR